MAAAGEIDLSELECAAVVPRTIASTLPGRYVLLTMNVQIWSLLQ